MTSAANFWDITQSFARSGAKQKYLFVDMNRMLVIPQGLAVLKFATVYFVRNKSEQYSRSNDNLRAVGFLLFQANA